MNEYYNGATVRVSCTFTVSGTATDPSTVTLKTKTPAGVITSYTYAGGDLTKDSTGVYHYDIDANKDGLWWYRFSSTGTAKAASEQSFLVRSQFDSRPQ